MPVTPRNHFNEDIVRAENILAKSKAMADANEPVPLVRDVRGSAVASAVGALDAYFCDAYVDCLVAVLRAYVNGDWAGSLPSAYSNQLLPAGEALNASRQHRPLWRIRMAAKKAMADESMLKIGSIDNSLNGILPTGQKIWHGILPQLLALNLKRLTHFNEVEFNGTAAGKPRQDAEKKVISSVKARIGKIIQYRHDWIHNCGRPKNAIIELTHGRAAARIRDIRNIVEIIDNHIEAHRLA